MDLQSALAHATQTHAANVVGLQIHGRTIEVYRPRFDRLQGQCKVEYREAMLFQHSCDRGMLDHDQLPGDALELNYFEMLMSDEGTEDAITGKGAALV